MFKPHTLSESYSALFKKLCGQTAVECRFPEIEDMGEIIAVYPQTSLVSCEAADGRINYSGRIILTVVYLGGEGKLCRVQKGAEFSHFLDDEAVAPANACGCKLSCLKTNVKREGSTFQVAAIISAEICVYARAEREYLAAADGAFIKREKVSFCTFLPFAGEGEVEDDFEADSVVDVLTPCADARITGASCSEGEIELLGEISLSLFAMRRHSPTCLERVIPFRCTLPAPDGAEEAKCLADAEITDLSVNLGVNEERGKCNVNFSCNLSFSGCLCMTRTEEAAVDLYSATHVLTPSYREERHLVCTGVSAVTERVSGPAVTKSKLSGDSKFLAAVYPRAECAYNPATDCAEGAVTTRLIYERDGEIAGTDVSLPVCVSLAGVNAKIKEVAGAAVCGVGVRLNKSGEPECEALIKLSINVFEECEAKYVSGAEEGGELALNDCAVSVYMPEAGDLLWDISKRLSLAPAVIERCNPGLEFPIKGGERIIVYRAQTA